jgi:anti-sigma factor RsiW
MSECGREDQVRHEQLEAMLPWYVNDSLEPGERAAFRAHLQDCPSCQHEVGVQVMIRDRMRRERRVLPAPMASLDGMMKRIEAYETSRSRRWQLWLAKRIKGRALERALIAQAAAILLLAFVVAWLAIRPEPPAEYRTLGASPQWQLPGRAYIQLVPRESATVAEVRMLLQNAGGRIVHGPSASGAYIVEFDIAEAAVDRGSEEVIAWLSAQPAVALARPMNTPEGH